LEWTENEGLDVLGIDDDGPGSKGPGLDENGLGSEGVGLDVA
jgi:hypothetical protein